MIAAYLYDDYVKSSIAAIDIMAFKLHSERRTKATNKKQHRRKTPTGRRKEMLDRMAMILRAAHEYEVRKRDANGKIRNYLTWREVADEAKILTKDNVPASSTVSRLADILFDGDGSKTYRRLAEASDRGRKLKAILEDAIDRYVGINDN